MNYEETLKYIHAVSWTGSRPGLERISELLHKMGDPQDALKFVHVGGTNGKGSFCAMLSSVLSASGYKTGLYTSPYVKYFNERMAINGEMISNDELSDIVAYVKTFADEMQDKPTEFELICAVAFEYFRRNGCDIVVLEVGLGGRLDATNVIKTSELSVITGISLDHTALLGDTVEKIAEEKAGICKSERPVLYGGEDKTARDVIKRIAKSKKCAFFETQREALKDVKHALDGTSFSFGAEDDLKITLLGSYQVYNAATVITAVSILRGEGYKISREALRLGLENAKWRARFELLCSSPVIVFDGGHNPEGVSAAVESISAYFGKNKVRVITGVMKDKDYHFISERIASVACEVFTVTPDNPRALTANEYAEVFSALGVDACPSASVRDAISAAIERSQSDACPIIALGSLYMYEEFTRELEALLKSESILTQKNKKIEKNY